MTTAGKGQRTVEPSFYSGIRDKSSLSSEGGDNIVMDKNLIILMNEEYGYREWCWSYPGTEEELIEDWKRGLIPFFSENYQGKIEQIKDRRIERWEKAQLTAHIHEEEDSWLRIGDQIYHHPDRDAALKEIERIIESLGGPKNHPRYIEIPLSSCISCI